MMKPKMKTRSILTLLAGSLAFQLPGDSTNQVPASAVLPEVKGREVSYAIGVDIARHFRKLGIEVDEKEVIQGFKDGVSGDRLRMPEDQMRKLVLLIQNEALQRGSAQRRNPAMINQYDADLFFKMNEKHPGVVSLTNGLQYKVLQAGKGPKPHAGSPVVCQYRVTYIDGAEFAASKPGEPIHFKVSEAPVKGWAEALPLMAKGSKWRLFVPSELAYGKAGLGKEIGPNMALIYDLELIDIQ
jgi:FKBP-type peptidyl-prolyl cis-trans isomerase FklB